MNKVLSQLFVLFFTLFFCSCKKSDKVNVENIFQKLQHNWTIVNYSGKNTNGQIENINGQSGDFMEFNSNGYITYQTFGSLKCDNSRYCVYPYGFVGEKEIQISNFPYTIDFITDSQLTLRRTAVYHDIIFGKEVYWVELTINLKR